MSRVSVNIGRDKYTTNITAGKHHFLGDEPSEFDGADKGPDPIGLLLGSLGSCSAITMRMYADRKEWDLERVEVDLDIAHEKVDGGFKSQIQRKIKLTGNLDEKQQQRLLKIADACPVAKIIKGNVIVESELI